MKQTPEAVGLGVGLIAFLTGPSQMSGQRSDLGGILLMGGIFLFGCGLLATAIGAKR